MKNWFFIIVSAFLMLAIHLIVLCEYEEPFFNLTDSTRNAFMAIEVLILPAIILWNLFRVIRKANGDIWH